ncbi:uncharacterized protein LOC133184655 [Saccostrea echinata]|uniref:uncharacterized protein LOC133184654 n=1 Tax=Saccostrea echinata TaxID=191078 RepID=UPI002A7EE8EC|nr:uncharacterized protein LOC133184654 [Saccostrea echinata]XP_061175725.1 uncharacterized protein LOC133184655 [Saccostrea echinata]
MGIFQSCLGKHNRVGVMGKEEMEAYEKVRRTMITEDMTERKGGVAFDLTFLTEDSALKLPPRPPSRLTTDKKEDFEKWRENQEKTQAEKQERAQQKREEAIVQKKIENAHKEMERLEKYVNISD